MRGGTLGMVGRGLSHAGRGAGRSAGGRAFRGGRGTRMGSARVASARQTRRSIGAQGQMSFPGMPRRRLIPPRGTTRRGASTTVGRSSGAGGEQLTIPGLSSAMGEPRSRVGSNARRTMRNVGIGAGVTVGAGTFMGLRNREGPGATGRNSLYGPPGQQGMYF